MKDSGLKSIVADLHGMRYTAADIARAVGRSERRIGQILHELNLTPPPLRTIDDLPHDIRERIRNWQTFRN